MDPAIITIISVIVANITGCFIVVCSFTITCYCIYSNKSKKNSIELSNISPDGGETKLKFEYQSEEKSSNKGGIIKLGKASTIISNTSNGNNEANEQYHVSSSAEIMNANTNAVLGCAQAWTKAVESNGSVSTTAAKNKEKHVMISVDDKETNSSSRQLYEDINNQAAQALKYFSNIEETKNSGSLALDINPHNDDIV